MDLFLIGFLRFSLRLSSIFFNFFEDVVNLFMKLQASNFTKFKKLGVKFKEIEVKIRI